LAYLIAKSNRQIDLAKICKIDLPEFDLGFWQLDLLVFPFRDAVSCLMS
jgi:hypothetical protein